MTQSGVIGHTPNTSHIRDAPSREDNRGMCVKADLTPRCPGRRWTAPSQSPATLAARCVPVHCTSVQGFGMDLGFEDSYLCEVSCHKISRRRGGARLLSSCRLGQAPKYARKVILHQQCHQETSQHRRPPQRISQKVELRLIQGAARRKVTAHRGGRVLHHGGCLALRIFLRHRRRRCHRHLTKTDTSCLSGASDGSSVRVCLSDTLG